MSSVFDAIFVNALADIKEVRLSSCYRNDEWRARELFVVFMKAITFLFWMLKLQSYPLMYDLV